MTTLNSAQLLRDAASAESAGLLERATQLYRTALSVDTRSLPAYVNLTRLLHDASQFEQAVSYCEAGLRLWPDDINLMHNHAVNLHRAHQYDKALAAAERIINARPQLGKAHYLAARVLDDLGRTADALEPYRRAAAYDLKNTLFAVSLGDSLLRNGLAAEALPYFDRAIASTRYDVRALALKTAALAELGMKDDEKWLSDPERMIKLHRLTDAGISATEVSAFNQRIAEFAAAHDSMRQDPAENATYQGWHSGELSRETNEDIARLKLFISHGLRERIAGLSQEDPSHPFVRGVPQGFDLRLWSVKLVSGGKMIPHIHPDGWLSGVYYADIPPVVNDPQANQAGWICFGPARNDIPMTATPMTRSVKPEPGLMVTFPSYFWHSTIPLPPDNGIRRLCLAFDLVPATVKA